MRTRLRRTAQPLRQTPVNPAIGCWTIVLIDGEPIRKKARRAYDKVLRDLETCKEQIEVFETVDNPGFLRWFYSSFGAQLTQARELNARLCRARALVMEVQQELFFGHHHSVAQAYRKVMRRLHEEENAAPEPPPFGTDGEPFSNHESGAGFNSENDFSGFKSEPNGTGEWDRQNFVPPPAAPKLNVSARVKELYRSLVRRLHPDKAGQLSPKEVEWWHQAQAAYERGDVAQLELIQTLCEIEDQGTKETSVARLTNLVAHFKASLRALKRRVTQYKRDPAWNFSRLADRSEIYRRAAESLREQIEHLLYEITTYEELLEKWKLLAASEPRTRRKARSRTLQDEELF